MWPQVAKPIAASSVGKREDDKSKGKGKIRLFATGVAKMMMMELTWWSARSALGFLVRFVGVIMGAARAREP